jgi:hypothetical protein
LAIENLLLVMGRRWSASSRGLGFLAALAVTTAFVPNAGLLLSPAAG